MNSGNSINKILLLSLSVCAILVCIEARPQYNENDSSWQGRPTTETPSALLQNQLKAINSRFDFAEASMKIMKNQISYLERQESNDKNHIEKMKEVEKSVKKMEDTHETWRNNFKVIKSAFEKIREKITFLKPTINT